MKKTFIIKKAAIAVLMAAVAFTPGMGGSAGAVLQRSGNVSEAAAAGTVLVQNTSIYTVEELWNIAAANGRQAVADDLDIKKKEMAARTVRSDSMAMSDSILSVIRPMEVALDVEVAVKVKQEHLEQLKLDVYKTAMNILLCEEEIKLKEQKLTSAREQLNSALAKLEAGTAAQDDVDTARYNADSSGLSLSGAREKLDSLYLEMRRLLNQPLSGGTIRISDRISPLPFEAADTDALYKSLCNAESSVYKAKGAFTIAGAAMDIAGKLYKKGDLYYDSAELDLKEAELEYAGAVTALEVKVKNMYNDALNRLDNLELAGMYAELASKRLDAAKAKYDSGAVSRDVYIKAGETLLDAEHARAAATVEFNGIWMEFMLLADVG